jgi:hypothetical protein
MKANDSLTDDAIGVFAINLRFNLDDIQTIVSEAITHVRLNALCPGSSSTFGLGRSQAIQTDLLRKLIGEPRQS